MRIGYARVSTVDQDHDTQVERLRAAGCGVIRAEKVSGKSREGRDELRSILEFIRQGDELIVVRLDRLGRSTRDVLNIVHDLDAAGAHLRVLEPEISTAGDVGRIVVTVLGMVGELERGFMRERQRAGIEVAKARGVYRGRPKKVRPEQIADLRARGLGPTAIAREIGVTPTTVHRELKRLAAATSTDIRANPQLGD